MACCCMPFLVSLLSPLFVHWLSFLCHVTPGTSFIHCHPLSVVAVVITSSISFAVRLLASSSL
ncbi:hypothetical protein GE21DRAFT_1291810, partial [Neurospora crassa]